MREQETMAGVEGNDTEITLGVGKLLALFFGLGILCGLSLGVGYSLGRNSVRQAAAIASPAPVNVPSGAANKPGASQAAAPRTPDCTTGDNCQPPSASTPNPTDLTFYQSVQQKDAHPQLTPPESASGNVLPAENRTTLGTGYLVQIAAV